MLIFINTPIQKDVASLGVTTIKTLGATIGCPGALTQEERGQKALSGGNF